MDPKDELALKLEAAKFAHAVGVKYMNEEFGKANWFEGSYGYYVAAYTKALEALKKN